MKDFNPFIHDHILHCERKLFCLYFLQDFTKAEILESQVNDCFKSNVKQTIKIPKNDEFVWVRNYGNKIKLPIMMYAILKAF